MYFTPSCSFLGAGGSLTVFFFADKFNADTYNHGNDKKNTTQRK